MARSRLGQNFLNNPVILGKIVDAADLEKDDTVVEIGPGLGRLTRLLAERVKRVVAIELDQSLFEKLKGDLIGYRNIELIRGDALAFRYEDIGKFKVVSNIPYYITTPLIFRLLDAGQRLKTMTLTIQKEVAERIVASPGGKDYGVLSIMVQYRAMAELKFIIPKEEFVPVPRVDSAVVHVRVRKKPPVAVIDEAVFFRVVKTSFSQRRKTLSNSLKGLKKDIRNVLYRAEIDPVRRPETLSIAEFARIADALSE
jgi:16S rRNA (adenine1518-N6/adenine1519-N6)-dimethyltransferase